MYYVILEIAVCWILPSQNQGIFMEQMNKPIWDDSKVIYKVRISYMVPLRAQKSSNCDASKVVIPLTCTSINAFISLSKCFLRELQSTKLVVGILPFVPHAESLGR